MNIRHGDMCLIGIEKLPEGLVPAKTNVLMRGSGGNDHAFTKGTVYFIQDNPNAPFGPQALIDLGALGVEGPAEGNHFGYFVAEEGNELRHPDHGKDTIKGIKTVRVSGIFGLMGQNEDTHEGMRKVQD